jgi:predicted RND superfamily exporter protein
MWHRIAGFIIKFRIALLSVLLVITVFMGWNARKVEISYEFTRAIPVDNPKYKEYQDFRNQFGEDGNMMVIAVQTDKFFDPAFFSDYTALVHKIESVHVDATKAVTNVLSIPGAFVLTKDTATGKAKTVALVPVGEGYNADSVRNTFYNLPFYKGFLYNPTTHAYLMAVKIDKRILNSKRDRTL